MPEVLGSEMQLKLLFQNLVQNALKYSRSGIASDVKITAKPGSTPEKCVISVSDNGIGIPEDRFSQIFKLFKKLGSGQLSEGSGLGLAMCRRVAINHGTWVYLTSVVGEGSTFSVELEAA